MLTVIIIIFILLLIIAGSVLFVQPVRERIQNIFTHSRPTQIKNPLIEKGYNNKQVKLIEKLNKDDQALIANLPLIDDIDQYLLTPNFCLNKLERYQSYQKNNQQTVADSVLMVNMNLDLPFYSFINTVSNTNNADMLINKYNKLPSNYKPALVQIDSKFTTKPWQVTAITKTNFEKMANDALGVNLKILVSSAYRTYQQQLNLYNNYVKTSGQIAADNFSARPGHSEHETGLTIDVKNANIKYNQFGTTPEFIWLKDNAHRYGFIIRYPEGKTNITGYEYEPWHIRYVGQQPAMIIYTKNITLEEYTATYTKLEC